MTRCRQKAYNARMTLSYSQAHQLLNDLLARHRQYSTTTNTPQQIAHAILSRERLLLAALAHPQQQYPSIHIAGTKGKGSTAAMLASVLQAGGWRVGLYTSPHLQHVRERIMVNNIPISEADFAHHVGRLQIELRTLTELRWFEAVTAIAFDYFAAQNIDIAIIEAGMGGRRDATNVIQPILSVITSLSFDHTHLFGKSLPEIASEKAGIIKPNTAVISASQPDVALRVLQQVAATQSAPLDILGQQATYQAANPSLRGQEIVFNTDASSTTYRTNLIGQHQAINLGVTLLAVNALRRQGWDIADEAVHTGLQHVRWPGRFELLKTTPPLVLDAAHNPASVAYFSETLKHLFSSKMITLVFGASADKNISAMLLHFTGQVAHLILTQASSGRAASLVELREAALEAGFAAQQITTAPTIATAFKAAQAHAAQTQLIAVTGSVYVVGEARTYLATAPAALLNDTADEVRL